MNATQTVRDIVAADFRAAAVFRKHGIDFCCGGKARCGPRTPAAPGAGAVKG